MLPKSFFFNKLTGRSASTAFAHVGQWGGTGRKGCVNNATHVRTIGERLKIGSRSGHEV